MIAKTRDSILAAVGALLAFVSLALALVSVVGFTLTVWYLAFGGGNPIKTLLVGLLGFGLAVFTRFLAELDKYEFVPAPARSTSRGRTVRKATR